MCKKCWEAASRHYPHLTDAERHDLLWGATCFPFGGPDAVERELIRLKANTDGSLGEALAMADANVTAAMNRADFEIRDR